MSESAGTASTKALVANSTGLSSRPSCSSSSGSFVLAAAYTSDLHALADLRGQLVGAGEVELHVASVKSVAQASSASVIDEAAETTRRGFAAARRLVVVATAPR